MQDEKQHSTRICFETLIAEDPFQGRLFRSSVFKCLAVRQDVFQREQGIERVLDEDGKDTLPDTFHVLLCDCWYAENTAPTRIPAGTVRGRPFGMPGIVKLERMAVLRAYRGSGLGRQLLRDFEEYARSRGFTEIRLHAQKDSVGFYRKHGFEPFGAPFTEAGITHQAMKKSLATRS
ncbi:MAG: GNAT family N-acetyltransferase [Candidatus Ryanbacteria bacterium]|nr:GNAT family N-acetyltransferase [Candidatus Ryanbacteria bacterium]